MADKRQVRRSIQQLQRVKTWQLVILLIIMGFVSATFLRLNNVGMMQRRDAVLSADKSGDQTALTQRLYDLQRYTSEHMNADTDGFYLEHQYARDAQKAVDKAKNYSNPNGNVNAKAEAACRPKFTVWSQAYVQCFTDELAKFPPAEDPEQNVALPSPQLYRHNFASPLWSPDFAGWSVMVCLAIILLIIIRLISLLVLRLLLKRHYRGI